MQNNPRVGKSTKLKRKRITSVKIHAKDRTVISHELKVKPANKIPF